MITDAKSFADFMRWAFPKLPCKSIKRRLLELRRSHCPAMGLPISRFKQMWRAVTDEAVAIARGADAICFGSLAQRCETSRNTIQRLVAETPADALRVFDINLRQQFYSHGVVEQSLQLANVLKLNDDELPILASMFSLTGPSERQIERQIDYEIEDQIERLAQTFSLRLVALTRGANGSLLYLSDKRRWSDFASRPVKVVDTVGAGDSFTAALVLGLLRKMDLDEINGIANEVARYVCSQPGATPSLPAELAQQFSI